jgi:hypothetical protein
MKNSNSETFADIGNEFPLMWLEEAYADGSLAETPDKDSWGLGVYRDYSWSCGFVIETPDLRYYGEDALTYLHRVMAPILSSIVAPEHLQISWFTWDQHDPLIDKFKTSGTNIPFLEFWRNALGERESKRLGAGGLRNFRCVCMLNYSPIAQRNILRGGTGAFSALSGVWNCFKDLGGFVHSGYSNDLMKNMHEQISHTVKRTQRLMAAFDAVPGLSARKLSSPELFTYYRRNWAPTFWEEDRVKSFPTIPDNPRGSLIPSYFILEQIKDSGDSYQTGKYHHKVFTLREPPPLVGVGDGILPLLVGSSSNIGNMHVTLTLRPRSAAKEKAILGKKLRTIKEQVNSGDHKFQGMKTQMVQLDAQLERFNQMDQPIILETLYTVHIWSDCEDKLDDWETILLQNYEARTGGKLGKDQFQALPYSVAYCSPGYTRNRDIARAFSFLPDEAVAFIPFMGQGEGVLASDKKKVPLLMETDFRSIYGIDLFSRGTTTAFNGMGIGGTGSGKSFFYNRLIAAHADGKTDVVVLDAAPGTPSYTAICKLLGGSYVKDKFRQNIFETLRDDHGSFSIPNDEESSQIIAVLTTILKDRGEGFSKEKTSLLSKALSKLYATRIDPREPVYMSNYVDSLESIGGPKGSASFIIVESFVSVLRGDWTTNSGGRYAEYVDGPTNIDSSWFTVFDLKSVMDQPDLSSVVGGLICRYIDGLERANRARAPKDRRQILLVLDEAWKMLSDPIMSPIVMGWYRAGRARNFSVHVLTQSFNDLFTFLQSTSGDGNVTNSPIVQNSSHFFLFRTKREDAKLVGETLGLNEIQVNQLCNLGGEKGRYMEMIHVADLTKSGQRAFNKLRVYPILEEVWGYTTDADDRNKLAARVEHYETLTKNNSNYPRLLARELMKEGWPNMMKLKSEDLFTYASIRDMAEETREKLNS